MVQGEKDRLQLCNQHLTELFAAIQRGDVAGIYKLEHTLTKEEECVACAYALRAKGVARQALDTFLEQEGYLVSSPQTPTIIGELRFWLLRLGLLSGLTALFVSLGRQFKQILFASRGTVFLGAFGVIGAFILAIATFLVIDAWLLED